MLPCYVTSLYPTLHISKTEICIQPTNRIIMWAKQENTHETQPVPEPITMGKRTVLVMFWEYFMAYMFLVAQLCPTLWKKKAKNPLDCTLPGSSVHVVFQARTLKWVAFPSPGDLPNPGIKPTSPVSPALQADLFLLSHWEDPKYS